MSNDPRPDRLEELYESWSARMASNPNMSIADLRSMFDEWHIPTVEPEDVSYKSDRIGSVDCIWVYPKSANTSKVILYTHGGGFAVGSAASHRKLVGHLAKVLGVIAVVIDYRRSPEFPYPAQIEDATEAYCDLLERGILAENITTAGDSAGGNLAIATVLNLRNKGIPLPGQVIAFSPWLDMEHVGETLKSNASTDRLVSKEILQGMSGMYLGEKTSRTDPLANPLKADLMNFPRLYVNAGSVETLLDNATKLVEKAKSQQVDVTLSVVDGMQHVFPFLAGNHPEVAHEFERMKNWFFKK